MKITAIKQQVKQASRYSIFVDDKYSFSLSDTTLLDSKLINGQELSQQQINEFVKLSNDDKIYSNLLRYAYTRPRTIWELETYLKRKKSPEDLISVFISKLDNLGLVNDEKFARSFVADRQLLRPSSHLKLTLELKQKHVNEEIIRLVMAELSGEDEQAALQSIVANKRRQSRYQDNQKLMQYLLRQGYNYSDIKIILRADTVADDF